jgi:hypothetical protein
MLCGPPLRTPDLKTEIQKQVMGGEQYRKTSEKWLQMRRRTQQESSQMAKVETRSGDQ